jgi:hypothetical protein
MSAPATSEPAAPGAAPTPQATAVSLTVDNATFLQLVRAMAVNVKNDAETLDSPSKLWTGLKALPGEVGKGVKAINWPLLIVAVIACAALAMHFPALVAKVF